MQSFLFTGESKKKKKNGSFNSEGKLRDDSNWRDALLFTSLQKLLKFSLSSFLFFPHVA